MNPRILFLLTIIMGCPYTDSFSDETESTTSIEGGQVWPSQPPEDCPFEPSLELTGIYFTGVHSDYNCGDLWAPSWASDGNLYSPWADGTTDGMTSNSTWGEKANALSSYFVT